MEKAKIIQKTNILSMNSNQKPQSKSKKHNQTHNQARNHNQQYQKQFQLLYRQRDNLPSQEAYQSVIFMKGKKYPNTHTQQSKDINSVKPTPKQLKNMIKTIEKQIKQRQSKKKSKLSNNNNIKPTKILTVRSPNKVQKQQCQETKRTVNLKRRKVKSPSGKSKREDTNRKQFIKHTIKIPSSTEYILLGDQFISIHDASLNQLQKKLNSYREQRYVQPQSRVVNNDSQISQMQLQSVQQYIKSKVILIQRWWRQKKKLGKTAKIIQTVIDQNDMEHQFGHDIIGGSGDFQDMAETLNEAFQHLQKSSQHVKFDDEQEDKQNEDIIQKQDNCNSVLFNFHKDKIQKQIQNNSNSNSFHNKSSGAFDDTLELRQKAAKIQFNTHKEILKKLYEKNKIRQQIYLEKLRQVQDVYQNQLVQIEQIRQILRGNAQKVQKIVRKTRQDILLAQGDYTEEQLISKIFGSISTTPPTRSKSTGCHYASPANIKNSQQKDSSSDSQQQQQRKQFQEQFFDQNGEFTQNFMINANFKQLLQQYKQRQTIKNEIQQRMGQQLGMIIPKVQLNDKTPSILTSITSIHHFLLSFFKFYTYYYKDDFLRFINIPYGYSPQKRLAYMQSYEQIVSQEDSNGIIYGLENVIGEQILEDFYDHYYQALEDQNIVKNETIKYDKIHNRAIFDAFNQALNNFRPYYSINGPPYLWNNSEKALTFYFISQQNIREVFEKTQFKVLKWASSLCGMIMNNYEQQDIVNNQQQIATLDQMLNNYRENTHPVIFQIRQQKLIKNQKQQTQDKNYQWFMFDQQKTALLYELSAILFEDLIFQTYRQCTRDIELQAKMSPIELSL